MAFSEKSARETSLQNAAVSGVSSFSEVVDSACERLLERQIRYSIRRILEMEERLTGLERELDEFLFHKDRELR